ncbi:PAS domain S-box protein [Actinoplanes sp. NPDC024001]|uniref:PAS domain-containing protein n=1 Tax=Actinoplanes sp. NPDC024001 TaxID=3154598 RepID=UPI0033D70631
MLTVDAPQTSAPPVASVRDRAVDATGLAFMQVDRAGLIRDWNPAAERLFGWRREEILGQPLADTIVPPALRAAHSAGFARRLVVGDGDAVGRRVEVPARHRDGRELHISMLIDSLGADGYAAFISDETDGHRARQELQRSNTLISAILQHTTAMISAKDLDGRYLFVNGEYERIFQVTAADIVGRTESELVSASVAAVGRAHDVAVIGTGTAKTVLEEVPFGDDIRQYVVTRVPLTDPDGSVYGVCTIAIDDTTRRRSEAALAAGEKRFWNTVNNAPGMLYRFRMEPDGTTRFSFVSEASREVFHLEPQEIIATPNRAIETIAEEDRQSFIASVLESARTLQRWEWRGSAVRRDGTRCWLYGVSRPHREPGGATVWDGMLLDRTREHNTEHDLADLVDRLATASFVAPAGPNLPAALEALVVPEEHASLAELWADAVRGERVDATRTGAAGPVHIRLRTHREGDDAMIAVACFERGRTP